MKDISLRLISEARFTSAFQLSSVLMSISTVEEGVFLNTNEAFLKTMGFSYDEVIGKSVTDLGIYENLADRAKIKNIFLKEGKLENQEVELRKKDGTPVPTLFSATHIHVEERKCWLVSMVDVSKLKKVEAMLRESEERIRLIMDSTGEGIYGIGLDGRCSFRNKACLRLLGYSEDNDILGRNIHDLIHYKNIDAPQPPSKNAKSTTPSRTASKPTPTRRSSGARTAPASPSNTGPIRSSATACSPERS
jgi:PAS domain S-box-containing protein